MMPYTVSEHYEFTPSEAVASGNQPHRVRGCAAALGRAARVQDLEAVVALLVQRHVRMAEHDDVGALAEARPHPPEATGARSRVVHHPDAGALGLYHALLREQPAQLHAVHVAVHAEDGRADCLELAKHLEGREIARVKEK